MVQNCFKIISRQRKKYTPAEPPPLKSDLFLKPSQNVLKVVVYFFDGFPYSIYHLFNFLCLPFQSSKSIQNLHIHI